VTGAAFSVQKDAEIFGCQEGFGQESRWRHTGDTIKYSENFSISIEKSVEP